MPEHYGNTTIGFKGENGETEPGETDPSAMVCHEIVAAHIHVQVDRKRVKKKYKPDALIPTGEWNTSGPNLLSWANRLSGGRFNGNGGNLIKQCACIPEWVSVPWLPDVTGPFAIRRALNYYGAPSNGGAWVDDRFVLDRNADAADHWTRGKTDRSNFPRKPGPAGPALPKDHYIYFTMREVCGPPCPGANCKCNGRKAININIDEKTKKYTLSDDTEITLTSPGDFKRVIQQVIAAEDAIDLDCGGSTDV